MIKFKIKNDVKKEKALEFYLHQSENTNIIWLIAENPLTKETKTFLMMSPEGISLVEDLPVDIGISLNSKGQIKVLN